MHSHREHVKATALGLTVSAAGLVAGSSRTGLARRRIASSNADCARSLSLVHSRAMVESAIVWSRSSLRRFLSISGREVSGSVMPVRIEDPKQLADLVSYRESMR